MVNGVEVNVTVRTVPADTAVNENRFGVSSSHARKFVNAYKNQTVKGYKVCNKYPMSGRTASVHAETFQWNVLNAKVSIEINKSQLIICHIFNRRII